MIAKNKLIILRRICCKTNLVRALANLGFGLFLVLSFVGIFSYTRAGVYTRTYTREAEAATSSTLNFQGRLSNSAGNLVADGTYSMEFNLYNVSSGGSTQWTETQGAVTTKNGYFSVQLGSVASFPGTIDWSQEQWLTMNVNGDGEMSPRLKLTAVPYAFRAGQADSITNGASTLTVTDILQKAPVSIQSFSSTNSGLRLNQTGSGGLLQLQGDGSDVFTVNKLGAATLGSSITLGDTSTTIPGTIRWNGSDLQGYTSSGWLSLTAGSGVTNPFRSVTKTANEIVNNSIALQPDDQLSFAIGANETWTFRFMVQGNAAAVPDFRFAVAAPVGATCQVAFSEAENAASDAQKGCGISSTVMNGGAAAELYEITGTVTNGANAGNVTLQWAQFTLNASNTTVYAGSFVEAQRSVGGSIAQAFIQDGNTFSAKAVLGTNDVNDLALETNGVERLTILSNGNVGVGDTTPAALFTVGTGDALQITSAGNLSTSGTVDIGGLTTLSESLVADGTATGTTATTAAVPGVNTTTVSLTGAAFANNDVILITNAGQDYYTRIVSGGGTATLTVSPAVSYDAGATVEKYNIQNVGATDTDYTTQANRFFQGYFLGGVVVGAGSTSLSDGNLISTGDLAIQSNGGLVTFGGNVDVTGTITGDGSGITNIDGSAISANSIADGSLSSNVAILSGLQTFTGQKTFSDGLIISASGLTNTGGIDNNSGGITEAGAISGLTTISLSDAISGGTTYTGSGNINTTGGTIQTNGVDRIDNSGNLLNIGNLTLSGAISGGTTISGSGNINTTGGVIQTNSTTRIDNSGNLLNIGALSLSGAISGGTSFTGSGNINTSAGDLQTAGITRIDNSGNLNNIGNITGSGALTLASGGSADLTLDSASNSIVIAGNDTSILRTGAGTLSFDLSDSGTTVLSLTNSSGGVASLDIAEGALQTAGTTRLTNGGALQNITGITSSGTITFSGLNAGGIVKSDGSGVLSLATAGTDYENPLTFGEGLTRTTNTVNIGGTITANRDIALGSNTFSFSGNGSVAIGSSSASGKLSINDGTTTPSLFIDKTGASGNILTLQKNGNGVFTIANGGATQISTDSTSALQVRNAAGTSNFFTVDTSGSIIQIGSSTGDATGVLFVLDSKTGADPVTGVVNGAQYYNGTNNKFRCYENGAWNDCITPEPDTGTFDDTTAAAFAGDINTTELFNDVTRPNITTDKTTANIQVSIHIGGLANTNNDAWLGARVVYTTDGSAPSCTTSAQVGKPMVAGFTTNNNDPYQIVGTFVHNPGVAGLVRYTVCSSNIAQGATLTDTPTNVTVYLTELGN